jgi:hypothetical protein
LLKEFGVTAQREIEKAVRQAMAEHRLKGSERLSAKLTLSIPTVGLTISSRSDFPKSMRPPKPNSVEPPWYGTRMPGGVTHNIEGDVDLG